jgi:hypothetical protein
MLSASISIHPALIRNLIPQINDADRASILVTKYILEINHNAISIPASISKLYPIASGSN